MRLRFRPHRSRGFTLIEILITISLIVLLLALAIPAVSFITGGRSAEGATNQLSAALGRARADAIGLQRVTGLMFFLDPATQNISAAFVQETDRPTGSAAPPDPDLPAVEVYLDLVADRDFISLPAGVLPMTIDNGTFDIPSNPTVRINDGFLGYNLSGVHAPNTAFSIKQAYGGVILFDGNGQLISRSYAFRLRRLVPPATPGPSVPVATLMGRLLFTGSVTGTPTTTQLNDYGEIVPTGHINRPTRSQVGVMLLDRAQFNDRNFANRVAGTNLPAGYDDPQNTSTNTTIGTGDYDSSPTDKSEKAEERYIDENGIALIINRYNGTVLRTE